MRLVRVLAAILVLLYLWFIIELIGGRGFAHSSAPDPVLNCPLTWGGIYQLTSGDTRFVGYASSEGIRTVYHGVKGKTIYLQWPDRRMQLLRQVSVSPERDIVLLKYDAKDPVPVSKINRKLPIYIMGVHNHTQFMTVGHFVGTIDGAASVDALVQRGYSGSQARQCVDGSWRSVGMVTGYTRPLDVLDHGYGNAMIELEDIE